MTRRVEKVTLFQFSGLLSTCGGSVRRRNRYARDREADMHPNGGNRHFWVAASALTVVLVSSMLRATAATNQAGQVTDERGQFRGQVVSASGALVVGGTAANSGHAVGGATIHLVPVTAIDVTTRMTASAIYAPPFPAEVYDEPLEDAIRLRGPQFPQSITDAQGNFAIAKVPNGRFFVHVTPGPKDTEHLPGGDKSRQSYSAEQLRGQAMTITVSSSPSAAARYVGSSSCLACHRNKEHWKQTAHKLGWTVPGAPGRMQDFSRHPDYFNALESFPAVDSLHPWNPPRAGRLRCEPRRR